MVLHCSDVSCSCSQVDIRSTNRTCLPLCTLASMMWKMVVDLPVPGGPWIMLRPPCSPTTACRCLAFTGTTSAGSNILVSGQQEGCAVQEGKVFHAH